MYPATFYIERLPHQSRTAGEGFRYRGRVFARLVKLLFFLFLVVSEGVPAGESPSNDEKGETQFFIDFGQSTTGWIIDYASPSVLKHGVTRRGGFCLPFSLARARDESQVEPSIIIDQALQLETVRMGESVVLFGQRVINTRHEVNALEAVRRKLAERFPGTTGVEARGSTVFLRLERHNVNGPPVRSIHPDAALFLLDARAGEILVLGTLGRRGSLSADRLETLLHSVDHISSAVPLEPTTWSNDLTLVAVHHAFCGSEAVSVLSVPRLAEDLPPRLELRQDSGAFRLDLTVEWRDRSGPYRERFAASVDATNSTIYPRDFNEASVIVTVFGEQLAHLRNPLLRERLGIEIHPGHPVAGKLRRLFSQSPLTTAIDFGLEVYATIAHTGETVAIRALSQVPPRIRLIGR